MKVSVIGRICIACAAFFAVSSQYATRAEKILAEINNPDSKYVVVISHRGDWRNYPENSIPAIESVIRMGASMMQTDRPATLLQYLRSVGRHD